MHFLLTNYEPGMTPGKGLTALQTFTTYFVIPTALFLVISGLALLGTGKKDKKSSIDQID